MAEETTGVEATDLVDTITRVIAQRFVCFGGGTVAQPGNPIAAALADQPAFFPLGAPVREVVQAVLAEAQASAPPTAGVPMLRHPPEAIAAQREACGRYQAFLRVHGRLARTVTEARVYAEIAAVVDMYLEAIEASWGGERSAP